MSISYVSGINLDKVIAKFENITDNLDDAITKGIVETAFKMEKRMKQELASCGQAGTRIAGTISIFPYEDGVIIAVGSEYAAYVEYGTGVVGRNNPHPDAKKMWAYDINNHGEDGWWYPTDDTDPNPIKWTDKSGTLRAWTKGQPAHPFAYNTWLYGVRTIANVVRKNIRELIGDSK